MGFAAWFASLPAVLLDSAQWWLAVPQMIQWVALCCLIAGLFRVTQNRAQTLSLCFPFAAALFLIVVQQVTPPPRILLYLAPWAGLFCAVGSDWILESFHKSSSSATVVTATIILTGAVYLLGRPYLFDERERVDYASLPSVIEELHSKINITNHQAHRLFAPLPCDLPSIYYMRQRDFAVPVNGDPEPDEVLWLIGRESQSPNDILSTPLVDLAQQANQLGPWQKVNEFGTLVLYRSQRTMDSAMK